jgi:hypothetical protein
VRAKKAGAQFIVEPARDPNPQGYRSSTEVAQGTVNPLCLPQLELGIDEIFGAA